MKRESVSLHDYGQGGLWAVIRAESAAQIREKYPPLLVFEGRPPMPDDPTLAGIRGEGVQDIAGPPVGWLAELPVLGGGR